VKKARPLRQAGADTHPVDSNRSSSPASVARPGNASSVARASLSCSVAHLMVRGSAGSSSQR
jgi:hypothetical protein